MSIQKLSSKARSFLYSFFNEAALSVTGSTKAISPGLSTAVAPEPGSLAFDFNRARYAARNGTLEEVNGAISDLIQKVSLITDPVLKDDMEGIRLAQQQFYRGWVRNDKQLQTDLGS